MIQSRHGGERKNEAVKMLKVVVFDGGYGGEFFADRLQEDLPVLEIVRVIDWRHADEILKNPRRARRVTEIALKPYIGKADLIILANHLLTMTSLRYFRRKYRQQKFIGLNLKKPDSFIKRDVLVMTTTAVRRTINYCHFLLRVRRRTKTLCLDSWPSKIDDGELTEAEIRNTLEDFSKRRRFWPGEIVLGCAQLEDVKAEIKNVLGANLKIYDSYDEAVRGVCQVLRIRGGTGKKLS